MPSEPNTTKRFRRYAFYIAIVIAIAVPFILLRSIWPLVVIGWTGSLGSHSVHDMVIIAGTLGALFGLAIQFYRPIKRVNAILLMPLSMFPSAAIGFAAGTEVAVGTLIFGIVSLVPLLLHPAGRSVLQFDRVASPNRLLVGLWAVGAIVLVVYGVSELVNQFTLTNSHTPNQHYGNQANSAFMMAIVGGLAVFRRRDWRFAAWITGFVALYLGVSSAVFPDVSSSLGLVGGVLMTAWAIAFVVMTERVRGGRIQESGAIEESAVR